MRRRDVALVRAPTNSVWLLGRILVDGPDDLDRVRILQARVLLETPDMRNERRMLETRELMRQRTVAPAEPVADWPAPNPRRSVRPVRGRRCARWARARSAERDRAMFDGLASLKLRPGRKFDVRAFSEAERRAIQAGIEQGRAEIRAARQALRQDGRRLDLRRAPSRQFRRRLSLSRARGADRARRARAAEATYLACNGDSSGPAADRAPAPIGSPSRPTACRRRAPSGRSPCTR